MFGTSICCAQETMKRSKASNGNLSVDQTTMNPEPANDAQDEKVNDANIDTLVEAEAGLIFIQSDCPKITRKIAQK